MQNCNLQANLLFACFRPFFVENDRKIWTVCTKFWEENFARFVRACKWGKAACVSHRRILRLHKAKSRDCTKMCNPGFFGDFILDSA